MAIMVKNTNQKMHFTRKNPTTLEEEILMTLDASVEPPKLRLASGVTVVDAEDEEIGGSSGAEVLVAHLQLDNDTIKALPEASEYPTLLAAPSAGTIAVPLMFIWRSNIVGEYTLVEEDVYFAVAYGDWDDEVSALFAELESGLLQAISGEKLFLSGVASTLNALFASTTFAIPVTGASPYVAKALKVVANNAQNFTGGNAANTIDVWCYYILLTLED